MSNMRTFINLIEGKIITEAPRSRMTPEEFIALVKKEYPDIDRLKILNRRDLYAVALKNNITLPSIFSTQKSNWANVNKPELWDLSGAGSNGNVDTSDIETDTGEEVETGPLSARDEDEKLLQKAKSFRNIASKGLITILGRSPKGKFVRMPGAEELAAQLERMLSRQLHANGDSTMEEQYEDLIEKVKLVTGQSDYVKSLLIVGAPSSGKTFSVMKTIKESGLIAGQDYVSKKGSITPPQLYRVLISQNNGICIFDDCDSVVDNDKGVNMLKGALDTDPIREVSNDTARTIDTAALPEEEIEAYTDALSNILRFVETPQDIAYIRLILGKMHLINAALKGIKKKKTDDEPEEDDLELDEPETNSEEDSAIINFAKNRLPNKIVYKGRIIFISNKTEDEWTEIGDGAIISRAFTASLNFRDDEMFQYIDKIKDKIPKPDGAPLSQEDIEQRQEVWDFVGELWTTGKLKKPVNFRLAMQAFDLRKVPSWQRILSRM